MRLWKLLLAVLVATLALSALPAQSEAKTFVIDNHYGRKVSVVFVVPTQNGWRVRGWTNVEPYSRKQVTYPEAGGNVFAYYAESGSLRWQGKSNDPYIYIVNNRMNHSVRQQPYGNNPKVVRVRKAQGYYLKLTGPPQQRQQQRQQNSFW